MARAQRLFRVVVHLDVLATDPVDAACGARVELDSWVGPAAQFIVTPHPGGRTVLVDLSACPAIVTPLDEGPKNDPRSRDEYP